ncbi:gamma-glutamyltransferase [Streptomyces cylindrosporus]|uniref:Gamma-glutamyltransferase family protein n=1 Tax=Streptomyces cylindrosporus TaxID=2927583 RepID=A0ABS9YJ01_9ACTN|nr:gamma-glutamyltransferase [Streptomyces cylindrosporus]MCI3276914.1 gamma-glutamyltransferase family protein [Streptomyces cylindrosporus]
MTPAGALALAAPHPAALTAARRAAGRGGNAMDAALAAAAALTVVYPHQCSLGGDLIALVHAPDGRVRAVLSVGAAAAGTDVEALRAADSRMPAQGPQTVTVPGVVAGWAALAEAYGTPGALAAALRHAAALAEQGATVSAGLARAVRDNEARIKADPGLSTLLTGPDGRPVTEGDPLPQPRLAQVLDELAADPWSFYRGAVAGTLAIGLRDLGTPLTAADLAAHRPECVDPVEVELAEAEAMAAGVVGVKTASGEPAGAGPAGTGATGNAPMGAADAVDAVPAGFRWWAAPPPSQGALLPALLSAAAGVAERPSPERTRLLAARCQDASAARDRLLGDPRGQRLDLDGLLDPAPLADASPPRPPFRPVGDTVAVTAVDSSGLAVSLIQSVYQTFGSGLCDPGTGIVLHNRGSAFSLLPGHPGMLRAGARPPHTLCPVIGRSPALLLAAGCQGGRAQPQILAQTLPALADPAADPNAVLAAPRWVIGARDIGFEEQTLLAEPGSVPEVTPAVSPGLPVVVTPGPSDLAGHVQVVRLTRAGRLDAASDPRADGGTAHLAADTSAAPRATRTTRTAGHTPEGTPV